MFDTLAIAQQLAAGGVARDQAEVIAKAIHDGLKHGNHVTSDQFRAGPAEVRADIVNLDTRLSTDIAGTVIATATFDRRHPAPVWMTTSKSPGRAASGPPGARLRSDDHSRSP